MKIFRNNISFFKYLSAATLLGIYISVLFFNSLHNYLYHEHHHQEVCTLEAEKDPCHKRVFHHDLTEGCKHSNHIFAQETDCQLCHAIIAKYYFPSEKIAGQAEIKFIQNALIFDEPFVFNFLTASKRLRGPPSISPFFT